MIGRNSKIYNRYPIQLPIHNQIQAIINNHLQGNINNPYAASDDYFFIKISILIIASIPLCYLFYHKYTNDDVLTRIEKRMFAELGKRISKIDLNYPDKIDLSTHQIKTLPLKDALFAPRINVDVNSYSDDYCEVDFLLDINRICEDDFA